MNKPLRSLPDREREIRQRLKDDFAHYAPRCLKVKTKVGGIEPFALNEVQLHLHERLEAQRKRTGKVRALILKGRQQGCSTYVSGRYYWRATHRKGCRVFILTHSQDGTDHLFGMVDRFHENCPQIVRPVTGTASAKELSFSALDSDYQVGTAGSKAVGRSQTIQLFHGSEVAFWPNADSHAAGVMQAIPDAPGTEVILESTANGLGNYFQTQWAKAERGSGDFEAIFVPWYWSKEYRRAILPDFQLTAEEREYADAYGLDSEQMAWRRNKVAELGYNWLFRQEYPATASEAFQAGGDGCFIRPELVFKARKFNAGDAGGPLVVGVDPARGGGDRTGIISRQGRVAGRLVCETLDTDDLMTIVGRCVRIITEHNPVLMNVDVTGLGAGVYDRLKELGHAGPGKPVKPVNFGSEATQRERFANKRAEMWDDKRKWYEEPAGVSVPDRDDLQADECSVQWGKGATRFDSSGRLVLESKDHIRERMSLSPDLGDALALTFAFPVAANMAQVKLWTPPPATGQSWMGR
jgi:hypothetical protein